MRGDKVNLPKAILAFFATTPRNSRRSLDPTTNPFNAERAAKQLCLEEQGRALGQAGVPRISDTWPSGPEAKAVLEVEQAQADYIASYQLRLKALQAQRNGADITARIAEALGSAEQFERKADNLLTENATQLQRIADQAKSRREELERFREQHRRIELPYYPSPGKETFLYVFAVLLIVVETAFNASFFAKGLSGGWLDGLFEAAGFSIVNVGVAFTVGAVVRLKNHVSVLKRLVGYVATGAVLGVLATFALMVSHYRDALQIGAEGAGTLAMQTLLSTPFHLSGPSSWILFGASFFAACFALWEGYSINDPYPGYGSVHRKSEAAAKRYEGAVQALRSELGKYRQSLIAQIERTQRDCAASIVELRGVIADKQRLAGEMPNEIHSLEKALVALVETFRTCNKVGRQERSECPEYFNSKPQLDKRALPDFSIAEDEALLQRQEKSAADFLGTKASLIAKIERAFNTTYGSIETVNHLFDPARQTEAKSPEREPATPAVASATVLPLRAAGADGEVCA